MTTLQTLIDEALITMTLNRSFCFKIPQDTTMKDLHQAISNLESNGWSIKIVDGSPEDLPTMGIF